ncbi:MAG: (4Fe-4S)-binding protein, partial [Chitinophagaceae bacterium]
MTKEYHTRDMTIIWQPEKCVHSANCVRLLPSVYHPEETPWVKPENATTQ